MIALEEWKTSLVESLFVMGRDPFKILFLLLWNGDCRQTINVLFFVVCFGTTVSVVFLFMRCIFLRIVLLLMPEPVRANFPQPKSIFFFSCQ